LTLRSIQLRLKDDTQPLWDHITFIAERFKYRLRLMSAKDYTVGMILQLAFNACVNLVLFVLLPIGAYAVIQKRRHGQTQRRSLVIVGFRLGSKRYLRYATMTSIIAAIVTWYGISTDVFLHEGSPHAPFLGLGISKVAIVMALLYGVVQTGFAEEVFFRGLIGGAAMRRFGFWRGNVLQSFIFLGPHLFLLVVMPEQWPMMPILFLGAMFSGWLFHQSHSFVGPWMIHAAVNVTTCLLAFSISIAA